MNGIQTAGPLPEGFVAVDGIGQLYKLRKGKRAAHPENMIRHVQIVYLYSEVVDGYYRRVLNEDFDDYTLKRYIDRKLLFYKPS